MKELGSELQKRLDRVADVRQGKEVEIELRRSGSSQRQTQRWQRSKHSLDDANAQTRARLAHRFTCVSGSLDARVLDSLNRQPTSSKKRDSDRSKQSLLFFGASLARQESMNAYRRS